MGTQFLSRPGGVPYQAPSWRFALRAQWSNTYAASNALAEGFEKRALPPPGYSKQVCLDLLRAKQESMDRGVPMPRGDVIICERCQELFRSLDCARDVCQTLDKAEVPAALRAKIMASLHSDPPSPA